MVMGMTDSQFKAYIRLLMGHIEEAKDEADAEKAKEKLEKILKNLQSSLED